VFCSSSDFDGFRNALGFRDLRGADSARNRRSFNGPASRAILPHLVRERAFSKFRCWASGIFQLATILGPVLGGVIYAIFRGPFAVYLIASVVTGTAIGLLLQLKIAIKPRAKNGIEFFFRL